MTALLVSYHASNPKHRDSILQRGLLPASPARGRPFGVYVYSDDHSFDHPGFNSRVVWECAKWADLWLVAYFGRATIDQYVLNALILLDPVTDITLVTGYKHDAE